MVITTRKAKEIDEDDFKKIEKEQYGLRDEALGFKKIPTKKPHKAGASKKKVKTQRMRTFKVKEKSPELWDLYTKGVMTLAEIKARF
jgi:hypothetical protein